MRICVCVKVVPRAATRLRIEPETLRLDRGGATEINANDEHAVEEGLRLRDAHGGDVVVISMGPAEAAESLRPALAMGADRAVVIADPVLSGSDALPTSRVLAEMLRREAPDIVIFGAQSSDGGGAMMWAAVAERLELPLLSGVRDVEVADGTIRAARYSADAILRLATVLPCVVALSGAVNSPRYPTFRDVVAAKRKEIAVVNTADLAIPPSDCGEDGSRTRVLAISPAPPRRGTGEIVHDDGDAARWLYDRLTEQGLI